MAAKKSKQDRMDRLAKIREKLAETDTGGGGKGWWSPKEGVNKIRILPEVGEMEFFFQEVGRHRLSESEEVYCPAFTSAGELECPICELVDQLYRAGDKESKKLAGQLRVGKSYWMNVIDRDNEDDGPKIFTPGVKIFGAIQAYFGDPDYGDITDEYDGTDITIEREGKGMETKYQVRAARYPSPLAGTAKEPDEDKMDEWFNAARDLSWAEASDDPEEDSTIEAAVWVLPYDRLAKQYDLDALVNDYDDDDEEDEEPEEEEEHPVKRNISQRRARRSRR